MPTKPRGIFDSTFPTGYKQILSMFTRKSTPAVAPSMGRASDLSNSGGLFILASEPLNFENFVTQCPWDYGFRMNGFESQSDSAISIPVRHKYESVMRCRFDGILALSAFFPKTGSGSFHELSQRFAADAPVRCEVEIDEGIPADECCGKGVLSDSHSEPTFEIRLTFPSPALSRLQQEYVFYALSKNRSFDLDLTIDQPGSGGNTFRVIAVRFSASKRRVPRILRKESLE